MLLTFDLGTTYFKVALFDRQGRLCDVCRIAPPVEHGREGRVELAAAALLDTLVAGLAELESRTPGVLASVECASFATQTNSFVLLDACDRPLTPIILWPDARAAGLADRLADRCPANFTQLTGIPRLSPQFMVAKLLWFQQHQPRLWSEAARVCLVSDYLTLLLCGRAASEAGAAGLTALVDVRACRWAGELLDRFGLRPEQMPDLVRAGTDLGTIAAPAADRLGLPRTCRLVVGCLDQYAGAIGVGNVVPGMTSETTGTVLATVRCVDRLIDHPEGPIFQGPAFRAGLYYRMVFGDVSARYLEWYRDQLPDRPSFEQLSAEAAAVPPGADGVLLRPDAPLTSPQEVFQNLSPRHTRGHAVRAIIEAVALALRDQVAALSAGEPIRQIRSAGGAARSPTWLAIKSSTLGLTVVPTQCPEPTSLGAAILAEAATSGAQVEDVALAWVRLRSE